jgi:hypothetical protein
VGKRLVFTSGLMLVAGVAAVPTACGGTTTSGSKSLYVASRSATCLRANPRFVSRPPPPTSRRKGSLVFEVFGPASRESSFPPVPGASIVEIEFEPYPGSGLYGDVGTYFFNTEQHARAFYEKLQAPYLRATGKPAHLYELRRNAVLVWVGRVPSYDRIAVGCLKS